jgi:hypothetical protein
VRRLPICIASTMLGLLIAKFAPVVHDAVAGLCLGAMLATMVFFIWPLMGMHWLLSEASKSPTVEVYDINDAMFPSRRMRRRQRRDDDD